MMKVYSQKRAALDWGASGGENPPLSVMRTAESMRWRSDLQLADGFP
jgi:hypothetical protein